LPQIGKDYGKSLAGKIVLDADNAVAGRDGAIADEVERDGIGVTSQKYLPGTRLVRAFNTLNYKIFASEANRPAPRLAVPSACDAAGAVGRTVVVCLFLHAACRLLRVASPARPDGHRRRRQKPALVVHRHLPQFAGRPAALWRAGGEVAAGQVHSRGLSFLRR